ncbi:MAG TPA: 8-amino-7-oxononanoate synthase [Steroidobacteraceae bacterium]|nr:8-amino-7-oxononanoate synthase [Steroidobacteraceae bacterium]
MDPRAIGAELERIERLGLTRRRRTVEAFTDPERPTRVRVAGRTLVNFSGNDYLGLAHHPALIAAMTQAAARWGAGSGAAHLVSGHGEEHARLEKELAGFVGRPRALLFSTGYMANLAVLSVLAGRGDLVLLDRLSHASLIDAALLARARVQRYRHADAASAERLVTRPAGKSGATVIATDGLFSMDGDEAPLASLAALAQARSAWLVVDDAHGLGVLGPTGRGTLEAQGLGMAEVPVLMGTLGKAFGSFGAFVAGSAELIELLIQRARTYIYTTALPQPVAAATRAALVIAQRESWRRARVLELTQRFRRGAAALGIALTGSMTPIQPVVIGESRAALEVSRELSEAGFWVAAIRPPTVPRGSARLRITFSAAHTEPEVDALLEALARALTRGSA